ncbi:hypothetical protein HNY73_023202 [Argiope bruennichi]|uniref:Uncharacterized protein n=1 Tax=Argiope bruennichi TaxID=94029 RepID=A0A8T0E7M7_ARGBR|nr:hypothetical protein HNY73_023202 [Argiope bruennichi]
MWRKEKRLTKCWGGWGELPSRGRNCRGGRLDYGGSGGGETQGKIRRNFSTSSPVCAPGPLRSCDFAEAEEREDMGGGSPSTSFHRLLRSCPLSTPPVALDWALPECGWGRIPFSPPVEVWRGGCQLFFPSLDGKELKREAGTPSPMMPILL